MHKQPAPTLPLNAFDGVPACVLHLRRMQLCSSRVEAASPQNALQQLGLCIHCGINEERSACTARLTIPTDLSDSLPVVEEV